MQFARDFMLRLYNGFSSGDSLHQQQPVDDENSDCKLLAYRCVSPASTTTESSVTSSSSHRSDSTTSNWWWDKTNDCQLHEESAVNNTDNEQQVRD